MLIVSGSLWWTKVYQNPQRVFEAMLANNLTTTSVTKTIDVSGEQNTLSQTVRLQLGAINAADWRVTTKQGNVSATTQSIGTPKADYVRYTKIGGVDRQRAAKILNVWGKNGSASLFSQALLDVNYAPVPPLGVVSPVERQDMLRFMKDQQIFTPDYSSVKSVVVNGRKAYEYQVSVAQAPYVRLMQAFETDLGLTALQDLSATQYQNEPAQVLTIDVDKLAHTMLRLKYKAAGYTATYQDYGVTQSITIPNKTIPLDQLKKQAAAL